MTVELDRPEVDPVAPRRDPERAPRWAGPVAGVAAGAVGVCAGALLAGMFDVVSPVEAVGSEFIERTPLWLERWAIDVFGTDDKRALRTGVWLPLGVASGIVVIGRAHV